MVMAMALDLGAFKGTVVMALPPGRYQSWLTTAHYSWVGLGLLSVALATYAGALPVLMHLMIYEVPSLSFDPTLWP